jgi:glycine/serine hydroxymethyltransferase
MLSRSAGWPGGQPSDTPSIHEGRPPANATGADPRTCTHATHARFRRRRHMLITNARALIGRLTQAHAHARETRAHAVRVSVSHAPAGIT